MSETETDTAKPEISDPWTQQVRDAAGRIENAGKTEFEIFELLNEMAIPPSQRQDYHLNRVRNILKKDGYTFRRANRPGTNLVSVFWSKNVQPAAA